TITQDLRIRVHVDRVPSHLLKPLRLGARREAWALNDHYGAPVASAYPELPRGLDEKRPQAGGEGVGGRDVCRLGPVIEGVSSAARPVAELIADHELAELELGPECARSV